MNQEEFLGLVRYAILLLDSYTPGTPRGGDPEPIEPSHEIHKTICEIETRYDDKKLVRRKNVIRQFYNHFLASRSRFLGE